MSGIASALEKLPEFRGVVWRGAVSEVSIPITLHAPLPTSRDPRVASEDFRAPLLWAIATTSGRDISFLSRHLSEAEIALLPGTTLSPASAVRPIGGRLVQIVLAFRGDEPIPASPTEDDLLTALTDAAARGPFVVTSPGRFFPPAG